MPLTFDFPLEKLKTYMGINPRPADFDAYWDAALAEMHALDPEVKLTPAAFQAPPFAECFDMTFTGVGGARVYAKLLRPKHAPAPHPALLMFHGYSGDSGDWADKLGYVSQAVGLASRFFDTPESFFAFAREFEPESYVTQYDQRLVQIKEQGLASYQSYFWEAEAQCRKIIEQACLGTRVTGKDGP